MTPDCVGSDGDNGSTPPTVLLTESEFSIFDWGLAADGALPAQTPAGAFRNHRARVFTCWMSVTHPSGDGSTFRAGLKILDQGGRLWLASEEPEPAVAGIKIRRVRWPSGNNRDSLVLYAHQPDQDKAVAYTWGDVDASRIAMNLRWMQASCTLSDDQRWPRERRPPRQSTADHKQAREGGIRARGQSMAAANSACGFGSRGAVCRRSRHCGHPRPGRLRCWR